MQKSSINKDSDRTDKQLRWMTKRDQNQDDFVLKLVVVTMDLGEYQHFLSPLWRSHLLATYTMPCLEQEKPVISFSLEKTHKKCPQERY